MFRFAHPIYLYLLTLIPLFTALFVFLRYRRKHNLAKFGDPGLLAHLMPDVSSARPVVKFTLMNEAKDADLAASELIVEADGATYTITPPSATNEIFVALPGFADKTIIPYD